MSDHVLLNLLNELRKRHKTQDLPSILSFFSLFNNIEARLLDSIYPMIFKLVKNCVFGVKMSRFCQLQCYNVRLLTNKRFYRLFYMALYHSQTRHHVKMYFMLSLST